MENKLLFGDYPYSRNKTHHPTVKKSQLHHYSIEKEGGEGRGKEKKKIMIAEKNIKENHQ